MKAPLPTNEAVRLQALHEYRILDSLPERGYDDLTRLASHICGTPVALITLIDRDRQWLKSRVGLDVEETSRDVAFCAHAILNPELTVVPDTAADARFADNSFVTADPHIRFYAGAPLVTEEGHALGTLCVIDRIPRELDSAQRGALRALARQVLAQLELRRHVRELDTAVEERARAAEQLRAQAEQASQYQAVLMELTRAVETDLDAALRSPTRVDAETLDVERVSVWFASEDEAELVCRTLHTRGAGSAWACPSPAASWRRTADAFGWRAGRERGAPSSSRFRRRSRRSMTREPRLVPAASEAAPGGRQCPHPGCAPAAASRSTRFRILAVAPSGIASVTSIRRGTW